MPPERFRVVSMIKSNRIEAGMTTMLLNVFNHESVVQKNSVTALHCHREVRWDE